MNAINTNTFMDTGLTLFADLPHKVRSLDAETIRFGRKELDLALHEMPGLAALREEYALRRAMLLKRLARRLPFASHAPLTKPLALPNRSQPSPRPA